MPRIEKPKDAYKVVIIESERGWGQKIDETIYYDNEAEAKKFVADYNRKHNPPGPAPDWYMIAEYVGKVQ